MTVDELTDHVLEWENQRPTTTASPDRRRLREELHDVDLPALDDRGIIEFNTDEGLVGRHEAERDLSAVEAEDGFVDRQSTGVAGGGRTVLVVALVVTLSTTLLVAYALGEELASVVFGGLVALAALAAAVYRLT